MKPILLFGSLGAIVGCLAGARWRGLAIGLLIGCLPCAVSLFLLFLIARS